MTGRLQSEVWKTALLLSLPAWLVLGGLAVAGLLSPWAALAGAALASTGLLLIVRAGMRDLEQAAAAIDAEDTRDAAAPVFGPAAMIARAATRLRQRHRERIDDLSRELAEVRTLFGQVPAPLLLLDQDGNVRLANRAAEVLLERDSAAGPLVTLIRDPEVIDAVGATLADGEPRQVEFTLNHPRRRILNATVARLEPEAGPGPALILIEDLTVARRVDQMRVDFVANASHELRTPLSTLTGYIETLDGPASEDPSVRKRFLDIMHSQATRMARLVDDLMSLSRIELNEFEYPDEPVDVRTLVQDQVEALQITARERLATFHIDLEAPDDRLVVVGDRDQLIQVVQNILDNAIKYGRAGEPIRISMGRMPAGEVTISVIDAGDGIAPEHVERLTERFYRVDRGRSRELGGTGLGLAIVKHIVNRHRGRLEIESTLGVGSTFTVVLPPYAGEAEAASPLAAQ